MSRVAVLGTGIMGGHMARRLAAAGHAVTGWNRSASKLAQLAADGVGAAGSAREALSNTDAAIVMLSTGPVVDDILFGAGAGGPAIDALRPGALLIVMSSIPVETARVQAQRAADRGLAYLDAPVSGGEPGARDGTLAIMVGGSRTAFESAQALLGVLGRATLLGPPGSGQLAKLANQVIVGATLIAISEALTLAGRGGADPIAVREALMGGFGDSKVLRVLGERMVHQNFEPGSPAAYQLKDMKTALALAGGLGLQLQQLQQGVDLFESLVDRGEGARDVSVIIREVARRSGEQIQ